MNYQTKMEYKKELIEGMKGLKKQGLKCYVKRDTSCYGWIITPSNNILYVQICDLSYNWEYTLEYKPSRNCGSGCQCLDKNIINDLSLETVLKNEVAGVQFARSLGAKLYTEKEKEEYFIKNWDSKNIQEI